MTQAAAVPASSPAWLRLFQSLKCRPFALIWSGQTASRVGDHLYQLAIAWWVLQKTGSATQMGAILIFTFVPTVLFLLIGGVTVDRFSRIRLMFLSDIGRGVLVAGVAALAYKDVLKVWHLYAASAVFGMIDAFFQPAYAAAVPQLTAKNLLPSANSLTSLSQQLGRIVGPPIAAALIAAGGTPTAFAINAVSFFIAAAALLPLLAVKNPPRTEAEQQTHFIADLREGLGIVFSQPWLWMTIVLFAIGNVTLSGPYSVSLPFLVERDLKLGVKTLGLLYAMFPLGYAVAAVWLGSAHRIRRRGPMIYAGCVLAGAMLALFGLPVPLALLALAAFINGAALELGQLSWLNLLQERIPGEKLGRVSSIDSLGSFALIPIGYALAGWGTDHLGAPMMFLLGGAITTVLALLALTHREIRALD